MCPEIEILEAPKINDQNSDINNQTMTKSTKMSDHSNLNNEGCSKVSLNSKTSDNSNVAQNYCSNVTILTSKSSDNYNVTQNYCSNVTTKSDSNNITKKNCSEKVKTPTKMSDLSLIHI